MSIFAVGERCFGGAFLRQKGSTVKKRELPLGFVTLSSSLYTAEAALYQGIALPVCFAARPPSAESGDERNALRALGPAIGNHGALLSKLPRKVYGEALRLAKERRAGLRGARRGDVDRQGRLVDGATSPRALAFPTASGIHSRVSDGESLRDQRAGLFSRGRVGRQIPAVLVLLR